ncbi:MAG: hypothetical protein OHK0039_30510 [Bacteroidia bacterium]
MIIDDETPSSHLTKLMLRELLGQACEILVFDRAEHALAHMVSSPPRLPELILLDINLRGMGSFEFVEMLEAHPGLHAHHIPIIMISTVVADRDMERAGQFASIKGVEEKPFTIEEMQALLLKYFPDLSLSE